MSVVGIIAEFNPLHNGHKKLLDYAKIKLKSECTVVVMSGNYTQRGECTLLDKYERAKTAVACGADLVIQMPVCASTMNASDFAKCGVSILEKTGIVDTLLFGSEDEDITSLRNASKKSKEDLLEYSNSPNSILAIEYLRALDHFHSSMEPHVIKRVGASYNDVYTLDMFPSSTSIRNALYNNDTLSIESGLPESTLSSIKKGLYENTLIFFDDLSWPLHYKLLTTKDFSDYLECNDDLSNKIIKNMDGFTKISEFIMLLKSKDLRYSRISRMLCHILLDLKYEHLSALTHTEHAPYIHILKASENGLKYLKKIKKASAVKTFASVNEAQFAPYSYEEILLEADITADNIYRSILTSKTKKVFPTEYTRKTEICSFID